MCSSVIIVQIRNSVLKPFGMFSTNKSRAFHLLVDYYLSFSSVVAGGAGAPQRRFFEGAPNEKRGAKKEVFFRIFSL